MVSKRGASGQPVAPRSRLYLSSLSHLKQVRIRRILTLAGFDIRIGVPNPGDHVALWGEGHTADRGRWLARRRGARLLYLEDGFIRSVRPGRTGEAPLSLLIDKRGPYFDARLETDLERLLQTAPMEDQSELARADALVDRITRVGIGKYNCMFGEVPEPGFVLVVDQTLGDRAVAGAQASRATFAQMLKAARAEHPDRRIVIQQHPETALGLRKGYLETPEHGITLLSEPAPSYALIHAAHAVYTVSSQLGFEAILAGQRPCVFGQPFYAGWGLSDDRAPAIPRRTRRISRAQFALATLIKYPTWYDPYRDTLTEPETVIDALEAQARAYREDQAGGVFLGMRLWKRKRIRQFFQDGPVRFAKTPAQAKSLATQHGGTILSWGGPGLSPATGRVPRHGVEDGFIRSAGLGAQLVPALSLVRDPLGMYFDPERPSALEEMIARSKDLSPGDLDRAARLRARIVETGATKYNIGTEAVLESQDASLRVLVVGQVEDDASILRGATGPVKTNAALLQAARSAHPNAQIMYKPHPDVEAGLRTGDTPDGADQIAIKSDPAALLEQVDEVWTMTSLMGFEALLRNRKVITLGLPFYSGWGLTVDLAPPDHPAFRRRHGKNVSLDGLVHAALIDYPRYFDPKTQLACPVEVVLDRLAQNDFSRPPPNLRALSKLQGLVASYRDLWR